MHRVLLVLAFLALPSLAAKPTFTEVAQKFPPVSLPLDSRLFKAGPALAAADVPALGFLKRTERSLGPLRQWSPDEEEGVKVQLHPLARFQHGPVTVLVLRYASEFSLGTFSADFLLTYSAKGALLDAVEFASLATGDNGRTEATATLALDGTIVRTEQRQVPMDEDGLPAGVELVASAQATHRLLPSGKFALGAPTFTATDGVFIDAKSHEELRVTGEAVFYRGNGDKPFQKLLRDGDTVRFKAGGKPYVLSWDEKRAAITCKNPDGTKQAFTREW